MSRFCLTLPSNNSTQYYPENTVACYTTKLANMIELEGDWEVGLLEISTPKDLVNVANVDVSTSFTSTKNIIVKYGCRRRTTLEFNS